MMIKLPELKSIEDASVIRKFSVVFTIISLFPFAVLAALFFILISRGPRAIDINTVFWAVFITGSLAFIGYLIMRNSLSNLTRASAAAREVAKGDLSRRIDVEKYGDNEITQLARTFNEVVQKLENNIKQLEKSRNTVQEVLLRVASGVSSTENVDKFLELILETTVDALDGNHGILLLLTDNDKEMVIKSAHGLGSAYSPGQKIPLDEEVAGWVIRQKKPLLIPRLHKTQDAAVVSAFEPPLICAPLVFQNKVLGAVLVSGKKQEEHFKEDELVILSNLASQIALAIENSRLNADNIKTYLETVTALALAVEARDVYSRGHSDRVGDYSVQVAKKLGWSAEKIAAIKAAAQLHDVGKIGIADEILRKPDFLNDLEHQIMQQHPLIGEGIIIPLHGFSHLRDPIRHHHEWINGEGYPDRLKGDQISMEAKILAVADSFDAMTTNRPYRKGMTYSEAKAELLRYRGVRYDPAVVDAFIECLSL